MKTRDALVGIALVSAAEALLINQFIPQLRPVGGVGRLLERFFLVNAFLYFIYSVAIYPAFFSPLRTLPRPKGGNLLTGNALKMRMSKPPGDQIRKWIEEIPNNGLIRLNYLFGADALIPTNEAMLKAIITDNNYDFEKQPRVAKILRKILGDGLILVEGQEHKFQRKHLLPSFTVQVIRELYPVFWSKAVELTHMLKEETAKPEFEFGVWCTRVTLDIIGIAGFGRDFGSLKDHNDPFVEDYQQLLEPDAKKLGFFIASVIFSPDLVMRIPGFPVAKELNRISKNLSEFAYNMSVERRAELNDPRTAATEKAKRKDILSLLVKSNDFSDRELANQALTMMAAGHETTSNTLAWCAYLLGEHPDIQAKLRAEIREHLPSPDKIGSEGITAAVIDGMPLLNAVCNETLRLYPTVPSTGRNTVKDTQLGGYTVPAGTAIFISPWAINRSTKIWGETAMEFIPDRWIDANGRPNNTGGVKNNYSIMTFLHGPRSCIGQGFARSELKCLVAAVVGRYDIKITRDRSKYFPAGIVTTKAANGMWLQFDEVEGW